MYRKAGSDLLPFVSGLTANGHREILSGLFHAEAGEFLHPRPVSERKPCHNARGKAMLAKLGGSRAHHLKRRYGISAADADAVLAVQGGLCAICRTAPAAHVDHDRETGSVRALLCFGCNGGLGQFRDDPIVLRAAADYVERHRARRSAPEEGSAGARPGDPGRPGTPPVGSAQRHAGRSSAARRAGHTSTDSRRQTAREADM